MKGAWQRWLWAEGVTVLRWETSLVPGEHQDSGSETDHSHGLGREAGSQPERVGLVSRPGLASHGRQQSSLSSGCTSCARRAPGTQHSPREGPRCRHFTGGETEAQRHRVTCRVSRGAGNSTPKGGLAPSAQPLWPLCWPRQSQPPSLSQARGQCGGDSGR